MYAIGAMFSWGLWGFLGALAERRLPDVVVFAWHSVAIFLCGLLGMPLCGTALPMLQIVLSLLGGAGYALGAVWMVNSMAAGGPGGVVVTLTSMYPLTVVLWNVIFFQKMLSMAQGAGTALALIALWCFRPAHEDSNNTHKSRTNSHRWFGLSVLSLLGYSTWTVCGELCVDLPSQDQLPPTAQGTRLVWQALGCALVTLIWRPPLFQARAPSTPVNMSLPRCTDEPLLQVDVQDGTPALSSKWADVGIWFSIGMGLSMSVGAGAWMMAVQTAPSDALNPIVMLTGLYGLVTILLMRVLLAEVLSWDQLCGVFCALLACALLS